ncbi:hypothetical protein D1R32_gp368 [Tunisvirus fontaine2]|uniref:Uncharacterized protein n=1 Tax=Tunisvirus fontaine2 TaxID=1421067 RepID=V9SEB6_9VIRU|nr:hypothetical protein D1R32_gp368 [Tunisvirus fontaine2]AHC55085.1 hypothetical protein TNS_ORF367 [Tunisvirus fontaine2]
MSEKSSAIIPKVVKYLEEDCLLSPQNYGIETYTTRFFIKGELFAGLEVTLYFRTERKKLSYCLCRWGEQFERKKDLVFYREFGLIAEDEAIKLIVGHILSSPRIKKHLKSPLFFEKKKNEELKKRERAPPEKD